MLKETLKKDEIAAMKARDKERKETISREMEYHHSEFFFR